MEKVGNDTLDIWGFLFFFFCNTGDWIQGIPHAKQALYNLCHAPSPFVFEIGTH
jgi:hypothetical protein